MKEVLALLPEPCSNGISSNSEASGFGDRLLHAMTPHRQGPSALQTQIPVGFESLAPEPAGRRRACSPLALLVQQARALSPEIY